MIEYYKNVLQELGYKNERRFLSEVVDRMADQWNKKNLFVIEAPTGYGKTTITATLALKTVEEAEKLIVAYPLRTLLEDQFSKVAKIAPQDLVGKRYMHEASSPYLIRPVTLTTIDTLSLTMFGIAPEDLNRVIKGWEEDGTISTTMGHYLFSWSSVMLSNIVLDEAHLVAEESKSLTYLIALIEHIISHDQKVILMSATMPTRFKELILDSLRRYKDKIEWMDFSDPDGRDDFVRSRLEKRLEMIKPMRLDPQNKFEKIRKLLDEAFERGYNRALMIFNTVREAVTFYKSLDGYENKLLIHSRFTDSDRMKKHDEIRRLKKSGKYVIVATQVVEAGMDISSDLLITDLSPMCALIQRFGRFLRYEDEKEGIAYIWYDAELTTGTERYKVYDHDLCRDTLNVLNKAIERRRFKPHVPTGSTGYKPLLDEVYRGVDLKIEKPRIDEMLRIFTNLGDISQAVDLFMNMEGSFVRSSMMIPVKVKPEMESVSLELDVFLRLLKNGRVTGYTIEEDKEPVVKPLPNELVNAFEKTRDISATTIMKYISCYDVEAFLIEGDYGEELGLDYRTEGREP